MTPPAEDANTATSRASDLADRLLDEIIVALQEFTTDELLDIADHRAAIHAEGWMQRMIREYVEIWR